LILLENENVPGGTDALERELIGTPGLEGLALGLALGLVLLLEVLPVEELVTGGVPVPVPVVEHTPV
jgi:hypothetical protein